MVKAAAVTFWHPESGEVMAIVFLGLMFGAPLGYAAGCVVAGVLLLMDLTESKFARWRKGLRAGRRSVAPAENAVPRFARVIGAAR